MAFNQNSNQSKQAEQSDKAADTAKATIDRSAEQSKQFADVTRDGVNKMSDLQEQAAENTKKIVQRSVETASQQAREAAERFNKSLGFTGEDSERLARQSKQNMEAVARCGTVLTQAFQDASRGWFGLAQNQWQRNLDGMNKLTRAKSVQEFAAIQSELARESLQHIVQDSRSITETSARAVEEAGKAFTSVAQTPTLVR
ncbi:phasin family protein [Methylobacterium durans]|uniref:Phasin n=1 Tax=Methylobacterium durans TaxID=2202825 RepID=A0A2U8WAU7_9HYPH|nr:phasin family protein [Methylobacterium durans]AWN43274.1 phasin [Methylobacterium durans]